MSGNVLKLEPCRKPMERCARSVLNAIPVSFSIVDDRTRATGGQPRPQRLGSSEPAPRGPLHSRAGLPPLPRLGYRVHSFATLEAWAWTF